MTPPSAGLAAADACDGEVNREFIVSSALDAPDCLRARFEEFGYLYFPQAVARERCGRLLRQIMACLHPHLRAGASGLPKLVGEPFFETDPVWDAVYPRIQALHDFHAFFHSREMLALMRLVTREPVFVYPMKMARIATPRKLGFETPPHQDAYSHHAGPDMAGVWTALHDVTESMGRLKILPASHRGGVRPVFAATGVGGVQCEVYPHEREWHVSTPCAGDVVIFHSATVHKAEPNTGTSLARISVDTRFCPQGAPVFFTNLEPHHGWRIPGLDWSYIYRGWPGDELKYYWQRSAEVEEAQIT